MFEGLFQPMHLLIILVIALLVFGPKRLPEVGRSLGEGIRALKDSFRETQTQLPAGPGNRKTRTPHRKRKPRIAKAGQGTPLARA